jgi:hypothetical protein
LALFVTLATRAGLEVSLVHAPKSTFICAVFIPFERVAELSPSNEGPRF